MNYQFEWDEDYIVTEDKPNYLLKEGECKYKVLEAENYVAKSTGNKSIRLLLQLEDETGKRCKEYDYLTPNGKLPKFLIIHKFIDDLQKKSIDVNKIVGLEGILFNKHRDYNNQKQNSVYYYIDSNKSQNPIAPKKEKSSPKDASYLDDFEDDSIPF